MKVESVYNKISAKYHETVKTHFYNALLEKPAMLCMIRKTKIKDKIVLDLGCGSGRYTRILLRYGGKLWGIDPSKKLLEIAKKENKKANLKLGTVYKLPFKSNFFDLVVAGLVIDHFKNLNQAFKEISRVLKKDGIFIFSRSNPVAETAKKLKNGYYVFNSYFKEGKRKKYWPTFGVTMPYYHITFESLIKVIIKNGFVIEDYIDAKPVKKSKILFPKEYKAALNKPCFSIFKVRKIK